MTSLAANTYDTLSSVLHGVSAGPLEAYKQSELKKLDENNPVRLVEQHFPGRPQAEENIYESAVVDSVKGVGDIVAASLKLPMTFTHGLAKGFHNVPRLYGDQTVREPDKITGVASGMAAAGKVDLSGAILIYVADNRHRGFIMVCMTDYLASLCSRTKARKKKVPWVS